MTNEESNEAAGRSDILNETMSVPKETYADEDSGPYIVLLESVKKDQLIGKLHIMGVGFRGQLLPSAVRIFTVPYRVKLSIPSPIMCA